MKKKDLQKFRSLLESQLKELVAGVQDMLNVITDEKATPSDLADLASEESDRNFLLRIKGRERNLIHKVQQAIKRIEDGSFGKCELCGEEIDVKRLLARPITTQCIECKTEMEHEEKRLRKDL